MRNFDQESDRWDFFREKVRGDLVDPLMESGGSEPDDEGVWYLKNSRNEAFSSLDRTVAEAEHDWLHKFSIQIPYLLKTMPAQFRSQALLALVFYDVQEFGLTSYTHDQKNIKLLLDCPLPCPAGWKAQRINHCLSWVSSGAPDEPIWKQNFNGSDLTAHRASAQDSCVYHWTIQRSLNGNVLDLSWQDLNAYSSDSEELTCPFMRKIRRLIQDAPSEESKLRLFVIDWLDYAHEVLARNTDLALFRLKEMLPVRGQGLRHVVRAAINAYLYCFKGDTNENPPAEPLDGLLRLIGQASAGGELMTSWRFGLPIIYVGEFKDSFYREWEDHSGWGKRGTRFSNAPEMVFEMLDLLDSSR